jgi:hypothetical protein
MGKLQPSHPIALGLFIPGAVVIASGFLYTLTITCFGCPNGPIELCTCVTNGLMTRNMFLIMGASILALGGVLHLLEIKKSKRAVGNDV